MFYLKQRAAHLLARALPLHWSCDNGYRRRSWRAHRYTVAAFREPTRCLYTELTAPAPLHLALRLLLYPLALVDWACDLPRALWCFPALCWRYPNPSFPWPPLP